jgi:hypothetical protein
MTDEFNPIELTFTEGPFIVGSTVLKDDPTKRRQIAVVCAHNTAKIVALTGYEGADDEAESIANAALFSTSHEMLDLLVDVMSALNTSKEPINIETFNERYSTVLAKLANEAGEETRR